MKFKTIITSISILCSLLASAQQKPKLDDFGRIVLNAYVPQQKNLTLEVRNLLETKLNQITTNYGMSGSEINPRFTITAAINIGTKDIIGGPPQMIAQNIEVTIFIGDFIENKLYSNTIVSLKGIGTNENKALIDAIKKINPKNNEVSLFIEEAKSKIVTFYSTQCDILLNDAFALQKLGKYDEAIYKLSVVPNVCHDCFSQCQEKLSIIYKQKINEDCNALLLQAKTIWAINQNGEGANRAGELLNKIKPGASCQTEVGTFIKEITSKLEADAKVQWELKIKQYEDQVVQEKALMQERQIQSNQNFELDKIRTNAYCQIAIEFAKNQPKTIYNNINWR